MPFRIIPYDHCFRDHTHTHTSTQQSWGQVRSAEADSIWWKEVWPGAVGRAALRLFYCSPMLLALATCHRTPELSSQLSPCFLPKAWVENFSVPILSVLDAAACVPAPKPRKGLMRVPQQLADSHINLSPKPFNWLCSSFVILPGTVGIRELGKVSMDPTR